MILLINSFIRRNKLINLCINLLNRCYKPIHSVA